MNAQFVIHKPVTYIKEFFCELLALDLHVDTTDIYPLRREIDQIFGISLTYGKNIIGPRLDLVEEIWNSLIRKSF